MLAVVGGWMGGDSTVWLAKLSLIFSNNSCCCISFSFVLIDIRKISGVLQYK